MNILALLIGLLTGIVSGLGIGGGSLLVLYLTTIAGIAQQQASGMNLLYFIGCAPAALIGHIKNHQVKLTTTLWCVTGGLCAVIPASLLAQRLNADILRRLFGVLILYVAYREWHKSNALQE